MMWNVLESSEPEVKKPIKGSSRKPHRLRGSLYCTRTTEFFAQLDFATSKGVLEAVWFKVDGTFPEFVEAASD